MCTHRPTQATAKPFPPSSRTQPNQHSCDVLSTGVRVIKEQAAAQLKNKSHAQVTYHVFESLQLVRRLNLAIVTHPPRYRWSSRLRVLVDRLVPNTNTSPISVGPAFVFLPKGRRIAAGSGFVWRAVFENLSHRHHQLQQPFRLQRTGVNDEKCTARTDRREGRPGRASVNVHGKRHAKSDRAASYPLCIITNERLTTSRIG